ncbi:MAG: type II CRISPR RNA-guided endonuclease Cas9 [Proteocatella sp.]
MGTENNDFYLGLDVGTDSVGWAVTDKDYNLLKFKGKSMWGVRLFESGKTAEDRRLYRCARRRTQRQKERIKLLQDLFSEEIAKIDMGFFLRLEESKYYLEDKTQKDKYSLFADTKYTDKEYHTDFPTIYHLRRDLVEWKKPYDIRLVYLAIHNIIKNRGHFLFEGRTMDNITSFNLAFDEFIQTIKDELGVEIDCLNVEKVGEILKSNDKGIPQKKKMLKACFAKSETKIQDTFMSLIIGSKVKLSDLFGDGSLNDEAITSICLKGDSYEQDILAIEDIISEKVICIQRAKALFDWAALEEIRKGKECLSYAKVDDYEKHKKDLEILKKFVRKECDTDTYNKIFKANDLHGNYASYVRQSRTKSRKLEILKSCTQEDLYKFLKKQLPKSESEEFSYISKEMELERFLPKQINKNNGIIPYQMHLEELEIILENVSKVYPFFNEKDDSGYTNAEKIKKLLTFRIPYFVGPLNTAHQNTSNISKGNSWIVRNPNVKITPWNFEKVVDQEASAERFIRRMTNKCTYLVGEDVLPKDSLLYSEYMVLNELNNLKINGERISVELKKQLYDELFLTGKKVTGKQLERYLQKEGIIQKGIDTLSGFDIDFKSTLKSYADFKNILEKTTLVPDIQMIEELILWICIFGENRKMLTSQITEKYGKELSKDQIKKISNLKYSGWGRLSQTFLTEIYHHAGDGEVKNIITMLRETNDNLMQLLSRNYDFGKNIENYNRSLMDTNTKISYDIVEDLYVSPAVRRSIWQTLEITDEIVKVNKEQPKRIFIEVAREEREKTRTKSRRAQLIELYSACKQEERDWIAEIESKDESKFRSDRLYLYYTQMGRCMYTGKYIPFEDLYKENIYDIDHIYPQSKTKDDSLNNKVLVSKESNALKSDRYPIDKSVQADMKSFWGMLKDKNYISQKKYDRLTRNTEFSDSELADFIARQLVETRQSTKALAQILSKVYPESEIVYSKAGNVSEFRKKYDLIKVRDINDYHHANDAYLNIVVGNVYHTKFTNNPANFIKNSENRKYSLNRVFDFDVKRNQDYVWKTGEKATIAKVKSVLSKNNILFTRYAFSQKGGLFDQTIMKKGKGQLPTKLSDSRLKNQSYEEIINKYGGYNKVAGSYFTFVEHIVKGKAVRTIEYVPVYLQKEIEKNPEKLKTYLETELNNPQILIPKIKINTLFQINGFKMHLSGRTGNQLLFKGANQLCISRDSQMYLKKLTKYVERNKQYKKEFEITEYDKITKAENLKIYDIYLEKLKNTVYKERLSSQIKTFENGRDIFIELSVEEQVKLLVNALNLFKCSSVAADLSFIKGAKSAGILVMNNKIDSDLNIKIINQSPTGLFEQVVDLQKI